MNIIIFGPKRRPGIEVSLLVEWKLYISTKLQNHSTKSMSQQQEYKKPFQVYNKDPVKAFPLFSTDKINIQKVLSTLSLRNLAILVLQK